MRELPLNSTIPPTKFLMVSAANNFRPAPGLSPLPTVEISKNCGPFIPALGQVLEIGYGWYELLGHVQDRDTPGELTIHGIVSDANIQCVDPTYVVCQSPPTESCGFSICDAVNLASIRRNSDIDTNNLRLLAQEKIAPARKGQIL